ncbi:hypothetical protein WBG99_13900 [Streptomyces sp. TG1A-60]|uniref:hypothetical protein n=1 Tax=Streptomyces sp. TG1A-60 TaxID=3129111 RepID=UPI0030D4817C
MWQYGPGVHAAPAYQEPDALAVGEAEEPAEADGAVLDSADDKADRGDLGRGCRG